MLGASSRDKGERCLLLISFFVSCHRENRVVHIVVVESRNTAVPDVVDHDVPTEGSHSQLIRVRAMHHCRHGSPLATKSVSIIEHVVFGSQIVHEEASLLSGSAEKLRACGIGRNEIEAPGHVVLAVFQIDSSDTI